MKEIHQMYTILVLCIFHKADLLIVSSKNIGTYVVLFVHIAFFVIYEVFLPKNYYDYKY